MAKICNTRAKVYETRGVTSDDPSEHVESEGERVIKQMVQKQLDTTTSLQEELNRVQHFKTYADVKPLTEYIFGEASLKEFEETVSRASQIEELKSFDLTDEEIRFFSKYETERFPNKRMKIENSVLSARLSDIFQKIEKAKQNKITLEQRINIRSHEKEIGLSVKPNSEHTKLLNFVLSCQPSKKDILPPDHPMNKLKSIEEDLFGHLSKEHKKSFSSSKVIASGLSKPHVLSYRNGKSLWDVEKEVNDNNTTKKLNYSEKRVYTCKPEILYTIHNGEISLAKSSENKIESASKEKSKCSESFVITDATKPNFSYIPLELISENRLCVDEIQSLDKFSNYSEGVPSQILYLKNLSKGVTKEDLVSLFSHFENANEARIMYRLMNGRMRGQAFVTFPTVDSAKIAMQFLNGFIFKGKPIIIQYSKGKGNANGFQ